MWCPWIINRALPALCACEFRRVIRLFSPRRCVIGSSHRRCEEASRGTRCKSHEITGGRTRGWTGTKAASPTSAMVLVANQKRGGALLLGNLLPRAPLRRYEKESPLCHDTVSERSSRIRGDRNRSVCETINVTLGMERYIYRAPRI